MKILFLVPDGVGIRNYLYSSIIMDLNKDGHEVVIGHTISDEALVEVEKVHETKFLTLKLPMYLESIMEKFLRETICFARLQYNIKIRSNKTLLKNWSPAKHSYSVRFFYSVVEKVASVSSSYKWIEFLEKKYANAVKKSKYLESFESFLDDVKPDVVFNTHQRSLKVIPMMIAAKKINCRNVSAIYSWDNLPKARLSARADEYLVWSEYMKNEMKVYYPEVSQDKVYITGTPQFDFYKDKNLYWDKDVFYDKFNLDINRPTICFSGDDYRTSPHDPSYLADLADIIDKSDFKIKPQVLFRRCPVDLSGRYDIVIKKYSHIIKVADPLWNHDTAGNDWALVYPSYSDVELLVNMALHCESVYNVGSTMAHDFAMFNKPGMYINYDHSLNQVWKTNIVYQFEHFKSMEGLDAVVWINSKKEIYQKIKDVLSEVDTVAPERIQWLNTVNSNSSNISKRIAEMIGRT